MLRLLNTVLGGVLGQAQAEQNFENQKELADLNNKYAEAAAEKAYQRQVEQWNRETEYNDPASQRARLQNAGLSVSNMYGGSGAAAVAGQAGDLSQVPQNEYAQGGVYRNMPNKFEYMDYLGKLAEVEVLNSQKEKNLAEAREVQSRIPGNEVDPALKGSQIGVNQTQMELNRANNGLLQLKAITEQQAARNLELQNLLQEATMESSIQKANSAAAQASAEVTRTWQEIYYRQDMNELEKMQAYQNCLQIQSQTILNYAYAQAARAGIELTEAQKQECQMRMEAMYGENGYYASEVAVNNQQIEESGARTRVLNAQGDFEEKRAENAGKIIKSEIGKNKSESFKNYVAGASQILQGITNICADVMTGGATAVARAGMPAKKATESQLWTFDKAMRSPEVGKLFGL